MTWRWGLTLLLAAEVAAAPGYTGALAVGRWQVQTSRLACELSQPLAKSGVARLTALAGGQYSVSLPLEPGHARIRVATPVWREDNREGALGVWQSEILPEAVFDAVLRELASGYHVEFAANAPVRLSTMGFRGPFAQFQRCRSSLLPLRFADLRRSKILFGAGSELTEQARATLDRIALWAAADGDVTYVTVDGHTDRAGTRAANLELSKLRAEKVAQYLREQGAPADKLRVRWHGERYPLGGAANADRRVTVRLDRGAAVGEGADAG